MCLEFSKSWQQLICRYAACFGQSNRIPGRSEWLSVQQREDEAAPSAPLRSSPLSCYLEDH